MKEYSTFIFESFAFDQEEGRIEFRYTLDDEVKFLEVLELPMYIEYQHVLLPVMDRALFALHLIGGASYFKTCCPKKIEVRSGILSPDQAAFWNTVYEKGLGEFFYHNKIDPTGLINFPSGQVSSVVELKRPTLENRMLVPFGGGKDSIVTAEILKKAGFDITLMRMGGHPIIDESMEVSGLPSMTVERTLSPQLFEMNRQGALNGHVPITAYLSFLNVLLAILYGYDHIVMSNERSASEGNTEFAGRQINHQWSKSLEFEKMCAAYIQKYIATDLKYFSLLRHLSELSITRYFGELPQYFTAFSSCNTNWKIEQDELSERWCGECPKCAFAFCLMAAFLPKETLITIFGKNLFEETPLLLLYRELLGLTGIKPFECVGTPDEVRAAFLLAHKRGELEDTAAMQMFLAEALPKIADPDALVDEVLNPGSEHAIPEEFLSALHAHQ